jgi:ribose transport system substrate-binding protein
MNKRQLLTLLAVVAAAITLTACGEASSDGGGTGSESAPKVTASKAHGETKGPNGEKATPITALKLSPAEVAKVKAGNYTAAFAWHEGGQFTTAVEKGALAEFDKLGVKVVASTDAEFDPAKQKNDIETVMAKKPSAMISLPVDPVSSASAYRKVSAEGTKLVLLSNLPPGFVPGKDYVALATDDLYQMGKQAADAMAAAIGGEGKIAYLYHDASYYVTNERDQAFKETIEKNYPKIEIVAEEGIADPNKAEEQAASVLVRNPELDGAYVTFSTPPGEGALSALRSAGNKTTKMVSLDISDPLAIDMARGGNVAALVVDEAYALGEALARAAAYGLLEKEAPPFLVAPALTVTKENLAEGYMRSLHAQLPKAVAEAEKGS